MMQNSLAFDLLITLVILTTLDYVSTNPITGQQDDPPTSPVDNSPLNLTNLASGGFETASAPQTRQNLAGGVLDPELFNSGKPGSGKGKKRPGFPAKGGQEPLSEDDRGLEELTGEGSIFQQLLDGIRHVLSMTTGSGGD